MANVSIRKHIFFVLKTHTKTDLVEWKHRKGRLTLFMRTENSLLFFLLGHGTNENDQEENHLDGTSVTKVMVEN